MSENVSEKPSEKQFYVCDKCLAGFREDARDIGQHGALDTFAARQGGNKPS